MKKIKEINLKYLAEIKSLKEDMNSKFDLSSPQLDGDSTSDLSETKILTPRGESSQESRDDFNNLLEKLKQYENYTNTLHLVVQEKDRTIDGLTAWNKRLDQQLNNPTTPNGKKDQNQVKTPKGAIKNQSPPEVLDPNQVQLQSMLSQFSSSNGEKQSMNMGKIMEYLFSK